MPLSRTTPGRWVKDAREDRRYSLRDLAELTAPYTRSGKALSAQYLSKLENDHIRAPQKDDLRAVAKALGRSEDEILLAFGYVPNLTLDIGDPELLRLRRILEPLPAERRRRAVDALEALLTT